MPQLEKCSQASLEAVHPAWGVLLQHAALHDTSLVCRLMVASHGLRTTVLQLCHGKLSAVVDGDLESPEYLQSFARFLPRHAVLLRDLRMPAARIGWSLVGLEEEKVLARAFWEAGANLCLQYCEVESVEQLLLQQMAAMPSCRNALTALETYIEPGACRLRVSTFWRSTMPAMRQPTCKHTKFSVHL